MQKRIAFLTIGQSPRDDVLPEVAAACRTRFIATERGVLDDLDDDEISDLGPEPGDPILASRLCSGRGVVLGKPAIERRLRALVAELDPKGFDLIVLLCTDSFRHFSVRTPFLEANHVVDHFARGLAYGARTLGVVTPEPEQAAAFARIEGLATIAACASPYVANPLPALRDAGAALAGTDMIVMHCIGYTEAMRQELADTARRPVLLSRRLVAHAIDLLLT